MVSEKSADVVTTPVSIIIPVLNEEATLPALFQGLERQVLMPGEIIFVDAGSTDGSADMIGIWCRDRAPRIKCRRILRPDSLPGAARNAGIEAAGEDWIAFLDAGIVPGPEWLNSLFNYAKRHNVKGVFGMCRFRGYGVVGRALCALSYGCDARLPVLPSSLFYRGVFVKAGLFRTDLRAGEDILWIKAFLKNYPIMNICEHADVEYWNFSHSLLPALKKWYIYGINAVLANVFIKQQAAYFVFLGILAAVLAAAPMSGLIMLAVYILVRGGMVPIKKSSSWYWWKGNIGSFFMAFFLGFMLDMAKTSGFLTGYIKKILDFLKV